MRRGVPLLALLLLILRVATAAEPPVPKPQGFVTDLAGVLDAPTRTRITHLAEELQAKTGAEIAVLTVATTQPLDDFTYAMRVAETWRPGRKKDDTGVLFLVAVTDRKVRILVGYGLEGILPDGRVGEIIDQEVVPEFRAGRYGDGVVGGVAAVARTVAAARGVTLTGVPPPRPRPTRTSGWMPVVFLLVMLAVVLYQASRPRRFRRGGVFVPWGFGGPFGGGGFGGGGGGFGGFGGGSFGGGGAGRSW